MTLDNIVGQKVPVAILKKGLAAGTLGHAYLFAGEAGLGKETTARATAQELKLQGGPFSELHILKDGAPIGIDEIRALRQQVSYASSGNQIWIIVDAERMSTEAANAFLKTLEEPKRGTYFFLTTTRVHSLLPTIISRCQLLDFHAIPEQTICQWLAQKTNLDPGDARILSTARLARGSLGKAWEYWQGPLLDWRKEVIEKLIQIPTLDFPQVLGLSLGWEEDRTKISLELQWFKEWHRDLLIIKNNMNVPLYNPDYESELRSISAYYSNRYLLSIINEITVMDRALAGNARIRFCLGYLLLLMKKGALI